MNTVISMFEASVIMFKNKAAVADPVTGATLTYGELDIQARRIAAKLWADGIVKGDVVIIAASRGVGYIAAILGVLMDGGVYVPLSDRYPAERVAYIHADCGAKLTIDDAYIASALEHEPIAVSVGTAPEDLALILYTSGSTGFPKGILHDHQSITGMVEQYRRVSLMTSEDIYGINSPFYFVAHLIDVFGSLLAGLTAVIVPEGLRGDPLGLADFVDANHITMLFISPKVLRYFRKKGSSLRFVIAAGERMSQIAPEGFALMNAYGMTETASLATCFMVDRAYDNTPIGKPVDDLKLYLLNDAGERCDEGEICLAGHRGHGYLNLPEQTAHTFTPNPFRDIDGFDTLIHTGDLGRLLPDGNLVYINRKDWMIKINGQRVEPGEIEAAMRRLPGVRDAAVKDFTDASRQTFIVAYYLSDAKMGEAELKKALSEVLPDYMVPSRFVRLDKFPVNANGKLDRKALPVPGLSRSGAEYVAPENERQATVTAAFETVLGVEKVGIDDDFFALGGDSIKVIMLQSALRKAGIDVPARAVFDAHTPRKLAGTDSQESALAAFMGHEAGAYPLTHAQMSVYLDCQTPGRGAPTTTCSGFFCPQRWKSGRQS